MKKNDLPLLLTVETRKRLMLVIETKLPPRLREDQAQFWLEHPELIPDSIDNLAVVLVPYKRRNKDGEWIEWI